MWDTRQAKRLCICIVAFFSRIRLLTEIIWQLFTLILRILSVLHNFNICWFKSTTLSLLLFIVWWLLLLVFFYIILLCRGKLIFLILFLLLNRKQSLLLSLILLYKSIRLGHKETSLTFTSWLIITLINNCPIMKLQMSLSYLIRCLAFILLNSYIFLML